MRVISALNSAGMVLAVALFAGPLAADPDKDESGHGREYKYEEKYEGGEYKYESDDGHCKVEEKHGSDGYKKEIKCDHGAYRIDRGFDRTAGRIFGRTAPGDTIVWQDRRSGQVNQVTPTRDFTDDSSRYCREYQSVSVVNNRQQQTYGRACRQPDGSWRIVQ